MFSFEIEQSSHYLLLYLVSGQHYICYFNETFEEIKTLKTKQKNAFTCLTIRDQSL